MTYQAILRSKVSSEALKAGLEDVLTATAIGAIAYGPPELAREWLATVAGMTASPDVQFEFWPQHHLSDDRVREPDVFVTDPSTSSALVIEAKLNADPSARQLRDEALAAREAHPTIRRLHLLTVSDRAVRPPSFRTVGTGPSPYATMRHASWADLYRYLEDWAVRPGLDAGHRRVLSDALAVIRQYGRDPFRGLTRQEVRVMARDVGWMSSLPRELAKLHAELNGKVHELRPPLRPLDTGVATDMVGARSFNQPEAWLPRHFTLRYGAPDRTGRDRYYFVRAVLPRQEVWVGYAPRHQDGEALLADTAGLAQLVAKGRNFSLVGVRSRGEPFEVLAGPLELSAASLRELVKTRHMPRVNLVRVYPMTVLSRSGANATLGREVVRVIRLCRSLPSLDAP